MKNFSKKESKKICTACCMISVFSLILISYKDEERIDKMNKLIVKNDWESLFKDEQWLECLEELISQINPEISPVQEQLDFLTEHFEEITEIKTDLAMRKLFKAKHCDSLLFCELPEGKIFYFPEDDKLARENKIYKHYFSKIGPTKGRVCMSDGEVDSRPIRQEFDVDPQATIIYLAIGSA